MIIFNKIRFKNFVSTGNIFNEIIFDDCDRTLVVGTNGSGKSNSIIDSIAFSLYGVAHRNISKVQLVNSTNNHNLLVELWFSIGSTKYMIERGLKPNIYNLYIDDVKQNNSASIRDDQAFLENEILQMNYSAFTNVAILSSAEYVPFLQQPLATRRALIEELLDIKIFGNMLVITKERLKLAIAEVKDINNQITSLNKQIQIQQKLLANINQSANISKDSNSDNIAKLTHSNSELAKTILTLNEDIKNIELLSIDINEKNKLTQYKNTYTVNIKDTNKTLSFYNNTDVCPTCTQSLDADNKNIQIITCNKKIDTLASAISVIDDKLGNITKQENINKGLQSKISDINNKIVLLEADINSNIRQIKFYNTPAVVVTSDITEETNNLALLQEQITEYQSTLLSIKSDIVNYEMISHMLSDGGIKSRIIDKYLPLFNGYINNYLHRFGVYINFVFDNTFNETIQSRYRDNFKYNSFSEGEKIKISLSIMLAFRDLAKLKNSVNTNILIMDEIFDSSLDHESNRNLMSILRDMTDTNIFVISHRSDIQQDDFDRVLEFKKENNFSVIYELNI